MQTSVISVSKKVATGVFFGFATLSSIFFLPTTPDFFDWNKIALSVVVAVALLVIWVIVSVMRKTTRITLSPMLLPTVLFAATWIVSAVVSSTNKVEAFTGMTLLLASLSAIFLTASHLVKTKSYETPMLFLGISGVILTFVSLLQAVGAGPSLLINSLLGVQLSNTILFSLSGSPLATISYLIVLFIGTMVTVLSVKEMEKKATFAVISGVILAGLLLNGYFMLPGKVAAIQLLPPSISWSIALETLKTPRTALFGVGPESFVNAFTLFRPISYNFFQFWTARYSLATNVPLHILTSIGVLGLAAYVLFLVKTLRFILPFKKEVLPFSVMVLVLLALQFMLPFNVVNTILLFVVLTFMTIILKTNGHESIADITMHLFAVKLVAPDRERKPGIENSSAILVYIFSAVVVLLLGFGGFLYGKVYASQIFFFKSILTAQKDDGLKTYEYQRQAIALNPYNMQLRRSFATTNFLLARSIAGKENPTDQDKTNISTLIQQSISEAKAAVSLDPQMTANWETLSYIYKNLIGTAQGADEWTVAAYVQAIQTDPTNPTLRWDLGGVYLSLNETDSAIQLFQQTISLKPDWANAYYNLGYAYLQKKDEKSALNAFTQALSLLGPNDEQREALQQEVEKLQKSVEAQEKSTQTTQQESVQETADGQIRIPENLGLPASEPPVNVPTPVPTSNPVVPETTPSPSPES